jgi:hypothetical protein
MGTPINAASILKIMRGVGFFKQGQSLLFLSQSEVKCGQLIG